MANEWRLSDGNDSAYKKMSFDIADGVACSFGALLQLLDERTASYAHLVNKPIAGVATQEHIANQGKTRISVYCEGPFEARAEGSIVLGNYVTAGASLNYVKAWNPFTADGSFGLLTAASFNGIIGRSLGTAVDSEVVEIQFNTGLSR